MMKETDKLISDELLAAALNQGILKRRTDSKRHVYYMLNGAPG